MTYGAGSLALAARRAGARTILERVRYDGIARCSRAFRCDDAALVVLSQLGPGVVRGDSVNTTGRIHADAHLIVTSQTATRVLGGTRRSHAHASWQLDERAVLELVGEPLIAAVDARYEASTVVDLGQQSRVLISELAHVPEGADVRLRTSVRQSGREVFYDAFEAAAAAPQAVGTFALIGLDDAQITVVGAMLDRVADELVDVRIGVGALTRGVYARIVASDLWAIRTALDTLRQTAWSVLSSITRAEVASPHQLPSRVAVTASDPLRLPDPGLLPDQILAHEPSLPNANAFAAGASR
jgi:urease accessory protein UreH